MASLAHYDNKYCIGQHFSSGLHFYLMQFMCFFFFIIAADTAKPPSRRKEVLGAGHRLHSL